MWTQPSARLPWGPDPPLHGGGREEGRQPRRRGVGGAPAEHCPAPPSAPARLEPVPTRSLRVLINGHDFLKPRWCLLSSCPSWGWGGRGAGRPAPEHSRAGPGLCVAPLLTARRDWARPTSQASARPHPLPVTQLACLSCSMGEELRERGRIFWNWLLSSTSSTGLSEPQDRDGMAELAQRPHTRAPSFPVTAPL